MTKEIQPCQPVQAVLALPGSKSYTHRALVAASLATGESLLSNALKAEDTELTAQALAQLGTGIDWQGNTIRVRGVGGHWRPVAEPIYLGNSGTSMRFLTALVALGQGAYTLTGSERLCQRPLDDLLQALEQLGVQVASERGDGCPPVTIQGGLRGGRARLSGAVSSQYVSALLFIGPLGARRGGDRDHRRAGLPPLRGPDPGGAGGLRHLLLPGRLPLFPGAGGANLSARGLRHRGRRLQRLVFLGRGRHHRRPGNHRQPERRFLPGRRRLSRGPGADGLHRGEAARPA